MTSSARDKLDLLAAGILAALICATAAANSVEPSFRAVGKPGRVIFLVLLGLVALLRAGRFRSEWRLRPWVGTALVAFCALALESIAWEGEPPTATTLQRSASLTAVVAVAAVLAGAGARSPATTRRLVDGILLAVGLVALAGLVVWLVDPSRAVQPASSLYPARFQGLESNPNAGSMLLAMGMPLALQRVLGPGSAALRVLSLALLGGFAAEVTASGSRGALLAGFLSLLVVLWFVPRPRRFQLAGALAAVASLALCAWIITLPSPLPSQPAASPVVAATNGHAVDAQRVLPLEREIGSPWWTHHAAGVHRSLFSAGSRVRALRGALEQAWGRPLLGVGFGHEAFVDRYYGFHSGNPENGYVGLLMQVGLVGLALFALVVALCVAPAVRRGVRSVGSDSSLPAIMGAVAAGLLLGLSQSYFHAVGNIVFVAFWVLLLLASATSASTRPALP